MFVPVSGAEHRQCAVPEIAIHNLIIGRCRGRANVQRAQHFCLAEPPHSAMNVEPNSLDTIDGIACSWPNRGRSGGEFSRSTQPG